MQDPEHQLAKCPKCHAPKNAPCTTRYGTIAEKVHYGRPYWSSVAANFRPAKLRGSDTDIEINLEQFTVITDLLKDLRTTTPTDKPVLFPNTNICADCGEPYNQPGLVKRCKKRHNKATSEMIQNG